MTIRKHPITGDPILFAPERAARPRAFGGEDASRCPFCAGHEADTPPALATMGDPWRVRVVPNKFPPVEHAEVIIEAPHHDATFDSIAHATDVVQTYVDRYRAHRHSEYVSLFKNEGTAAGASIPHIHSQLMPLPFLPPRVAREGDAFARAASCPLCANEQGAVIRETDAFRWLAPFASAVPYQQWIVPKQHVQDFTELPVNELAALLQTASKAMLSLADSYNWFFMNFPRNPAAHFYVELFPRMVKLGGFEFGSGTFVEIVDPAVAARRLKA